MKIFIILFVLFHPISMVPNKCMPCCYGWHPYVPHFYPPDTVSIECPPGKIHYVAKGVTMDDISRVVPVHLVYPDYAVHVWKDGDVQQRIDRHIDLLTGKAHHFRWVKVDNSNTMKSIKKEFCLVEGGGWPSSTGDQIFYIGYRRENNTLYLGRVPQDCDCLHAVKGWKHISFDSDFCVLTYDCFAKG